MWTQSSSLGSEVVQDGIVEGCALIFCKNSKIRTHYWTTVDRRMLDPTKKNIPHVQGQRRSPSKMVGGAKSCLFIFFYFFKFYFIFKLYIIVLVLPNIVFRIKSHTCQRCSEGSHKTLCVPGYPTEMEPDLPWSVWASSVEVPVSSGLPQGQGLWVQQT